MLDKIKTAIGIHRSLEEVPPTTTNQVLDTDEGYPEMDSKETDGSNDDDTDYDHDDEDQVLLVGTM